MIFIWCDWYNTNTLSIASQLPYIQPFFIFCAVLLIGLVFYGVAGVPLLRGLMGISNKAPRVFYKHSRLQFSLKAPFKCSKILMIAFTMFVIDCPHMWGKCSFSDILHPVEIILFGSTKSRFNVMFLCPKYYEGVTWWPICFDKMLWSPSAITPAKKKLHFVLPDWNHFKICAN